jgi:hypothetical protein
VLKYTPSSNQGGPGSVNHRGQHNAHGGDDDADEARAAADAAGEAAGLGRKGGAEARADAAAKEKVQAAAQRGWGALRMRADEMAEEAAAEKAARERGLQMQEELAEQVLL